MKMDMKTAIEDFKINLVSKRVESNPNLVMDKYTSPRDKAFAKDHLSHWEVTLQFNEKQLTIYHSVAGGYPPNAEIVLLCIMGDSLDVEDAETFEEWAEQFNLNPKSVAAHHTYEHHIKQREDLIEFFGDDAFDILCNAV